MFFADDSSIHTSHTPDDIEQKEAVLQNDLNAIEHYGERWAITFNASKTTQQTFSNRQEVRAPSLLFSDQIIPLKETHKHLGLSISTDLKFKQHVNEVLLKFNRTLSPLYPIAPYLPRNVILSIYTMYVQPHLDYCDTVFDAHLTDYDRSRLEKAQNRAARLITGTTRRTPTAGLLKELGWSPLADRRQIHKLQLYHKLKFAETVPQYIKDIIPNPRGTDVSRQLRSTNDSSLSQPPARTTSFCNSFVPSTTYKWNVLPAELRQEIAYKPFKKKLLKLRAPKRPHPYLFFGTKQGNTLHTKLRLGVSSLNSHRHAVGKADSPACRCGHRREDAQHFLLACPLHDNARTDLFHSVSLTISNFRNLSRKEQTKLLMYGPQSDHRADRMVATAVQQFIMTTRRFAP